MTKSCPKCGKTLPDDAKFCMDCGYSIVKENKPSSSILSNGSIFIVMIVAILVIGGIFIYTSGFATNNSANDAGADDIRHQVDLTITGVGGWDSDNSGKDSYTLYTEAIFNSVPDDLKGYNIKTSYYDSKPSTRNKEKFGGDLQSPFHLILNVLHQRQEELSLLGCLGVTTSQGRETLR